VLWCNVVNYKDKKSNITLQTTQANSYVHTLYVCANTCNIV